MFPLNFVWYTTALPAIIHVRNVFTAESDVASLILDRWTGFSVSWLYRC